MSASEFGERLAAVRGRIEAAARRVGRDPAGLTLIGVSKRMPATRVLDALRAGLPDLGENYVQEAIEKVRDVGALIEAQTARESQALPAPRWHLIGALQRNKAKRAVELFDCIHSLDRPELADELDRHACARSRRIPVFLQINLCREAQKGGAAPEAAADLLAHCRNLAGLDLRGLMTIPRESDDPEASRPVFVRLRELRDRLRAGCGPGELTALSMGMSSDFEIAVEEGATHLRVGTALFGDRPLPAAR